MGSHRLDARFGSYAISVDTLGKLRWASNDLDGDHLTCLLSEQVPEDYLSMLRSRVPVLPERDGGQGPPNIR